MGVIVAGLWRGGANLTGMAPAWKVTALERRKAVCCGMQIVRVNHQAQAQWGELVGEEIYVLDAPAGQRTGERLALNVSDLLPPAVPSKIVCVGRNYLDHIRELGHDRGDLPSEPGLFLKAPNTLAEPGGTVKKPDWSDDFHFEGELALVMARRAQHLAPEEALGAVLGYTCALDLTARDRQKTDLQWFRAKSADRFCPLGPWLQTDLDPRDVRLQTRVNGELRQDGRTSQMIFDLPHILSYVTRFMTLEAGDVVLTGTPEGVGALHSGDRVEVEIDGIGTLLTRIG